MEKEQKKESIGKWIGLGVLILVVVIVVVLNIAQFRPTSQPPVVETVTEISEPEPEPEASVNLAEFCAQAIGDEMSKHNLEWRWDGPEGFVFPAPKELSSGVQQLKGNELLVENASGTLERWEYVCNNNPDDGFYVPGPRLVRVNPEGDPFFAFPDIDTIELPSLLTRAAEDVGELVNETNSILSGLSSRPASELSLSTIKQLHERTNMVWNHCTEIVVAMGSIEFELSELSQTEQIRKLSASAGAMEEAAEACISASEELHSRMLGIARQLGGSIELSILGTDLFPELPYK